MKVFPFSPNIDEVGYKAFPVALEDDPNIYFHGTGASSLEAILRDGFRIPAPPLAQSVSFATTSSLSLRYASEARNVTSPEGCIIAVRYADLSRRGIVKETSILHDYTLEPAPEIIGYCIIPSNYRFV